MRSFYIDIPLRFPHPEVANPSGMLAVGGDVHADRLLLAYHYGIFPWYNPREPIVWWCPDPRFVIFPEKVKIAKSMRPYFNQEKFQVTYNQHFREVIRFCQLVPRHGQEGTWIDEKIVEGYTGLFERGYAMSVEVWDGKDLAGGLYGVVIGKVFFGESMFSLRPNASKFGFITLCRKLVSEGFFVVDCQQPNPYLESLGGEFIPGSQFHAILRKNRLLSLASNAHQ